MPKIGRTNEHWLPNLLMKSPRLLDGARLFYRLLNKILISSVGMKVVSADSIAITKGTIGHLLYFGRLVNSLKNVQGDIVECGVSSGTSFAVLCILVGYSGIRRHIWGFDSFEGLPAPSNEDLSGPKSIAKKGLYSASPEMVISTARACGVEEYIINNQITLVKGPFSQTLSKYSGSSIALLHIDADLYDSYKVSLENLWPKIAVGGIAAFDEYEEPVIWPGARKAVDEYFSQKAECVKMYRDPIFSKYYTVKLR